MKIIAINGSPKKNGNTKNTLEIMGKIFHSKNIDFEIIDIGSKPISGCIACGACRKNQNLKCVLNDGEVVNNAVSKMKEADAIILASPVYYSNISGNMKSFLDRVFVVAGANGNLFRLKIGASLAVVRRTGGSFTFAALNYYFTISEMMIVSSNYWGITHGHLPGEVSQDPEGIQIVEQLAKNMVWLSQVIKLSEGKVEKPMGVEKVQTNFIR